jgi:hypothetical protein
MLNRGGFLAVAVFAFLLSTAARAQLVPQLINYQGRLNDGAGLPVNNLSVPMVFGVWDAATVGSGSQLWTEAQSVPVVNGLYSVRLGAVTPVPASVFTASPRYLQVSVFGETLSPRAILTSVPYALNADLLDGQHATSFANATHGHAFTEITGSVTDAQVPDNITITNADKVDNLDASAFALAAHNHSGANITSGTIGNAYFSAYGDLSTEGYLDGNSSTDVLLRGQGDARFAAISHSHSGADITSGTIGNALFSAYGDLSAEGYLDDSTGTDLVTRTQGDARFAPLSHNHSGANITSGTIGNAYFSAYGDLSTEGYLDGNSSTDVITRAQGDTRFAPLSHTQAFTTITGSATDAQIPDTITISLANNANLLDNLDSTAFVLAAGDTITGSLQINGQLGIGGPPSAAYSLSNAQAGAPTYGAHLYGSTGGLYGLLSSDPTDHYVYLASQGFGLYTRTGNSDETGDRYGGYFDVMGQGNIFGVYAIAAASGANPAYGGQFLANANGTGLHYGVYAAALSSASSTAAATAVYGSALTLNSAGTAYGGYFTTPATGTNYGVYAESSDIPGEFANLTDTANYRVRLAMFNNAVEVINGTATATGTHRGLDVTVLGTNTLYGADYQVDSYATGSGYYAYGNQVIVNMHDNDANGYGYRAVINGNSGDGPQYAIAGSAYGETVGSTFGLYGYASNAPGIAYGLYATAANADDYAGYFSTGKVRIGSAGTPAHTSGSGDLYVGNSVEVNGDYYYSTPKTHYYSVSVSPTCPGCGEEGQWDTGAGGVKCFIGPGLCYGEYTINLPDRATVTAVRIWGATDATSHLFRAYLYRHNMTNPADAGEMASFNVTDSGMTLLDNTISYPVIDNSAYWYLLTSMEQIWAGTSTEIWGIRIDYTVEGPD